MTNNAIIPGMSQQARHFIRLACNARLWQVLEENVNVRQKHITDVLQVLSDFFRTQLAQSRASNGSAADHSTRVQAILRVEFTSGNVPDVSIDWMRGEPEIMKVLRVDEMHFGGFTDNVQRVLGKKYFFAKSASRVALLAVMQQLQSLLDIPSDLFGASLHVVSLARGDNMVSLIVRLAE